MAVNKQQNFIKGSAILIASNIVIKGINFLLLPLYTKYLTPELLGISDSITNLTAVLFPLLVMGLDSAFSAFYYDEHTEDNYLRVFNTTRITLIVSSLVPILIAIASRPIARVMLGSEEYYILIAVSLVSVSINLWHLPFSLLTRMRNRMGLFALVNTVASLTMILLNIFFLVKMHLGAYSLILSTACIQLLQLIMYVLLLRERLDLSRFDRPLFSKMMKYALPLVPNALATWVLALSDRYILLHFCGAEQVGLYGVGARFATAVSLVANGIYMSYTTYAYDKKGDKDDKEKYSRILNAFVFAIMGICVTVSIWAREIISIMAADSYAQTCFLIAPLLFSQLLYGMNTLIGYAITFEKKSQYILMITTAGAVANVILNFIFIPQHGALAASYTTLASYCIMVVLTYYYSQKLYTVNYETVKLVVSIAVALIISCGSIVLPAAARGILFIGMVVVYMWIYRESVNDYLKMAKRIIRR